MIDCEFDTLILSLVLIWIFYVFNFNLQLSKYFMYQICILFLYLYLSFTFIFYIYPLYSLYINLYVNFEVTINRYNRGKSYKENRQKKL